MKKNKSFLARFFSHNITLLVLSFILAFSAWFIINANSETETSVTIANIPVSLELSESAVEDGLQIFNGDDITASVEVSGNRVTVGSLSASDIQITANQLNTIIAPGTYTLSLSAKKTGLKTNYNIVSSVTPSTITVFVDRFKEQEFEIDNQLTVQITDSSHYVTTSLSHETVTLSGPETQMKQIDSVAVIETISSDVEDSQSFQVKLKYLDKDENELDLPLVTADVETVEATLSVLPVMNVNLTVDVINAPEDHPEISLVPSKVKIAGPQSELDQIENDTVSIGTLDFSKLTNKEYSLPYDITLPKECKVISANVIGTTVKIDLSEYDKTVISTKISSKIDATKYTTEFVDNNISITIYGPEDELEELTASDITVIADFTDKLSEVTPGNTISLSVPLTVSLSSKYPNCWIYGTYTASVNVSMK